MAIARSPIFTSKTLRRRRNLCKIFWPKKKNKRKLKTKEDWNVFSRVWRLFVPLCDVIWVDIEKILLFSSIAFWPRSLRRCFLLQRSELIEVNGRFALLVSIRLNHLKKYQRNNDNCIVNSWSTVALVSSSRLSPFAVIKINSERWRWRRRGGSNFFCSFASSMGGQLYDYCLSFRQMEIKHVDGVDDLKQMKKRKCKYLQLWISFPIIKFY